MRQRSFCPTKAAASSTWRKSSCEIGQNARTPPMLTSTPPLFTPVTVPSTGRRCWNAASSSAEPSAPRPPKTRLSTTPPDGPPTSTTVAVSSSPSFTVSVPSRSRSCASSITPSDLAPRSTNAESRPIEMIRPRTSSPTVGSLRFFLLRPVSGPSYSASSRANSFSSPESSGAMGSAVYNECGRVLYRRHAPQDHLPDLPCRLPRQGRAAQARPRQRPDPRRRAARVLDRLLRLVRQPESEHHRRRQDAVRPGGLEPHRRGEQRGAEGRRLGRAQGALVLLEERVDARLLRGDVGAAQLGALDGLREDARPARQLGRAILEERLHVLLVGFVAERDAEVRRVGHLLRRQPLLERLEVRLQEVPRQLARLGLTAEAVQDVHRLARIELGAGDDLQSALGDRRIAELAHGGEDHLAIVA